MKVKDLIKKLQEFPSDYEVFVGYDGHYERQEPDFELVENDVVFTNNDVLTHAPFIIHWAE